MVTFLCWVAVISMAAAFVLSLMRKWGWIEWAQVHAPSEFIYKLTSCQFCLSFWTAVIFCVSLSLATGWWWMLAVPVCSTPLTIRLW